MRRTVFAIVVSIVAVLGPVGTIARAQAPAGPNFDVTGTDARHVEAFLKALQAAVAVDNRIKVATLVDFPLPAWTGAATVTIRNEAEFQARYGRIFDASLKKAIADATVETLFANQQGIMFDGGRVWFRPVVERKNAIRIVAINEPAAK
jgi:hypothetical protein